MVVDGAGASRVPAERDELEEIVAVDEVPRVLAGREMQVLLERLGTHVETLQELADLGRLEPRRRNRPERLDDPLHRYVHELLPGRKGPPGQLITPAGPGRARS